MSFVAIFEWSRQFDNFNPLMWFHSSSHYCLERADDNKRESDYNRIIIIKLHSLNVAFDNEWRKGWWSVVQMFNPS